MNKLVSALHDATHLLPGVPTHSEVTAARHSHRTNIGPRLHNRSPHLQNARRHHQNPPRVLIAWQTWIGQLVGHGKQE